MLARSTVRAARVLCCAARRDVASCRSSSSSGGGEGIITRIAEQRTRKQQQQRANASAMSTTTATTTLLAANDDVDEEETTTATTTTATTNDEHFMRLALDQARIAASRGEVPVGALLVSRDGRTVLAAAGNGVERAGDATAHAELLCLQRAAADAKMRVGNEGKSLFESSRRRRGTEREEEMKDASETLSSSVASPLSPLSHPSTTTMTTTTATTTTTLWPRTATAGSTLYVTLEPCAMCAGAALLARVGRIVYGARSAGAGADGSWVSLLPRADSSSSSSLSSSDFADAVSETDRRANTQGLSSVAPLFSSSLSSENALAPLPARPHSSHPAMEVTRGVLGEECGDLVREFFRRRRAEGKGGEEGEGGGVKGGGGEGGER